MKYLNLLSIFKYFLVLIFPSGLCDKALPAEVFAALLALLLLRTFEAAVAAFFDVTLDFAIVLTTFLKFFGKNVLNEHLFHFNNRKC